MTGAHLPHNAWAQSAFPTWNSRLVSRSTSVPSNDSVREAALKEASPPFARAPGTLKLSVPPWAESSGRRGMAAGGAGARALF